MATYIRNHLFAVDNVRLNMIELFNEKETSISDRQNQNNILSMFYKMPTQSDIKLNYGN